MDLLLSIVSLLRVKQWLKNLMLFFPPFLGGALLSPDAVVSGLLPFAAFSAISSATYIINDIADLESDRLHPDKQYRPLPSGRCSKAMAVSLAVLLIVCAFTVSYTSARSIVPYLGLYLLISILYSLSFKNIPVVDLFCISSGFIIRLMAGGAFFCVSVSEWLFLSVLLLSLFLSTGKRLCEKKLLGVDAGGHRKVLSSYPAGYLDGILSMTGAAVLVTYSMYAVNRHSTLLLATIPLCCFGLMRYVFMVKSGVGGDPTESLTRDVPLFITGLLWALMIGWGIYGS